MHGTEKRWSSRVAPALGLLLILLGGCHRTAGGTSAGAKDSSQAQQASGQIAIDGSSTVYPITDAVARNFKKVQPRVWVRVDLSGSEFGLHRLCAGEIDIADASRPITAAEEALATKNGVEFIELPVAFDGLAVVVNNENTWVDHLTVEELKKIWQPGSTVHSWRDVREAWPDTHIDLCGMTTISGTFDYFTTAICGRSGAIRSDYCAQEVHVIGARLSGNKDGLGFFGYAWYLKFSDKLRLVPIEASGRPPVAPSEETIRNGSYQPLSRPIFIYVKKAAADRPEVQAFVKFYLENAPSAVTEAGYFVLPPQAYELATARFESRHTGSMFTGGSQIGVSIENLLQHEKR